MPNFKEKLEDGIMSKRIALFLAFCVVSMVFVIIVPSAEGELVATVIMTHHREGLSPDYTYPSDNYFRDEYDGPTIPDGYDNVYFSFLATKDGNPYVGNLWVYIYDSGEPPTQVYTRMVTLEAADDGVYSSWIGNSGAL
ncbi:MAG: hypothetical protein A7315_13705 [Candidatus Altiarchaeales archaeon WOR_SM1_79]|nr:MAG: hypothetical protein A7315_13705 [Candidatus Altiarchaeales archaeon WOR_SM1_79]